MRVRIRRWYPNQIMPILDPQIQTQKRRQTRTRSPEDEVHGRLPRYALDVSFVSTPY
jgi:hypothetical protein